MATSTTLTTVDSCEADPYAPGCPASQSTPTTTYRTITLANPDTLYYALTVEAQQLLGRNPTSAEEEAFARWYAGIEIADQTADPPDQEPTPEAAAYQWLYTNDRTEIEANQYLKITGTLTCMIQNDGGLCPTSTTTTWS